MFYVFFLPFSELVSFLSCFGVAPVEPLPLALGLPCQLRFRPRLESHVVGFVT